MTRLDRLFNNNEIKYVIFLILFIIIFSFTLISILNFISDSDDKPLYKFTIEENDLLPDNFNDIEHIKQYWNNMIIDKDKTITETLPIYAKNINDLIDIINNYTYRDKKELNYLKEISFKNLKIILDNINYIFHIYKYTRDKKICKLNIIKLKKYIDILEELKDKSDNIKQTDKNNRKYHFGVVKITCNETYDYIIFLKINIKKLINN